MVAHAPKLLLVGSRLHAGRGKHLPDVLRLHIVAVDVHRPTLNLGPLQPILVLLDRLVVQLLHICDVVREIQVKALCSNTCCRQHHQEKQ